MEEFVRDKTSDGDVLPLAVQKKVDVEKFDPNLKLFPRGAHMPLLVYLGGKGRRKPESIQKRETRARERRDNRAAATHMGAQNQGDARWPEAGKWQSRDGWGQCHRDGVAQRQSRDGWGQWRAAPSKWQSRDGWGLWHRDGGAQWQSRDGWAQWRRDGLAQQP